MQRALYFLVIVNFAGLITLERERNRGVIKFKHALLNFTLGTANLDVILH